MGMGWDGLGIPWMGMGMGVGQINGFGDGCQVKHDEHIGPVSKYNTLRRFVQIALSIALKFALR